MIVVETPPATPAPLSASVSVKVTTAEKERIRRLADDADVSMSAWARKVLTAT